MKAIWNNTVIAESNDTIIVESNHYFPPESVQMEFMKNTNTHSTCPWKGEASYYNIEIDGKLNKDAAWFYKNPSDLANNIKNFVAFWKGVEIIK